MFVNPCTGLEHDNRHNMNTVNSLVFSYFLKNLFVPSSDQGHALKSLKGSDTPQLPT